MSSEESAMLLRKTILTLIVGLFSSGAWAQVRVFACEPEWAALARAIGGEAVEPFSATTREQDVHYIQARPSLIARLRRADLLVCTGAGLEAGWLPLLLRRANNPRVQPGQPGYLEAAAQVRLLERPLRVDRAEGDVHPGGNPHLHLDPRNLLPVAEALAERLAAIDPERAAQYRAGLAAFQGRWQAAVGRWERETKGLRGLPVLVHHVDWTYLARWSGLEVVATLEPKPGVPPSSGHLSDLVDRVARRPVRCVLRTNYQEPRASEWISGRTGVPAVALPYTVADDQDLVDWYETLLTELREVCQ
jgi:zinc/manganese transport system substrate-binding protein